MVTTFPFDKVWELPKLEENEVGYDEEKMEELIGEDLLEILDAWLGAGSDFGRDARQRQLSSIHLVLYTNPRTYT